MAETIRSAAPDVPDVANQLCGRVLPEEQDDGLRDFEMARETPIDDHRQPPAPGGAHQALPVPEPGPRLEQAGRHPGQLQAQAEDRDDHHHDHHRRGAARRLRGGRPELRGRRGRLR